MRPTAGSYPAYFHTYVKLVADRDLRSLWPEQKELAEKFFSRITEEESLYRYAEDKWTIREVLQHIIDTERVFCYRALSIARKHATTLPSFDENMFAQHSHANDRNWHSLVHELCTVRSATEALFNSFNDEQYHASGAVSDYEVSVLALGYIIAGHLYHHLHIIRERYLDVNV